MDARGGFPLLLRSGGARSRFGPPLSLFLSSPNAFSAGGGGDTRSDVRTALMWGTARH